MVLFGLEFGDPRRDLIPMGLHRVTVTTRVSVLDVGARGLGDQRPQTHVFGFIGQVVELFVDDA